jgi:hypothetical protein
MSFRFKNNNSSSNDRSDVSPDHLQLEIVDENLKASSSTAKLQPHPSSSSMSAVIEHKETYVNMMYNNNATTGTSLSPGTVESPIEDDDDAEMMKSRTKKVSSSSRAPFRFKQFSLMKKGSFKLTASSSPPPTELTSSPTAESHPPLDKVVATFERQKSTTSSTGSTSRLKKLFMLSRADPAKKQQVQKDVSMSNLKHVL